MIPRFRPLDLTAPRGGSLAGKGATSLIGLVAQGGIRFAVNLVVGRIAGPSVLGLVATGLAVAQFLALLWPTTSGQGASRFLAAARGRGDEEEMRAVVAHLGRRFALAAAVLAGVSLSAWTVLRVSGGTSVGDAMVGGLVVALLCVGLSGQAYTRGVHYGAGAVGRVVSWDVACSLLGLAGTVACLMAGVRGFGLLAPLAAGYLMLTLACWPWGVGGRPDAALAREIDRFVLLGSVGTLASAGLVQLSLVAAAMVGGVEGAGQYSAAWTLALPLTLASSALSLVLYPSLSEAAGRGDEDSVRSQVDHGLRGVLMIGVPTVGALAIVAEPLVGLVWGTEFEVAATLLPLLLLAVLGNMAGVPCVNALTGSTRAGIGLMAVVSLVGLAVASLVWWGAGAVWGVLGIATGYAVGVVGIAAFAIAAAWRRWRPAWTSIVVRTLVAVAAVAALTIADDRWPGWTDALGAVLLVLGWGAAGRRDLAVWRQVLAARRG